MENRKLEYENNGQLIKKCQSVNYTCYLIRPNIPLLVDNLVEEKNK